MPKNREAQPLKREASEQFYGTLLEQATAALAAGEPEDALSLTDRALTLRPDEALIKVEAWKLVSRKKGKHRWRETKWESVLQGFNILRAVLLNKLPILLIVI